MAVLLAMSHFQKPAKFFMSLQTNILLLSHRWWSSSADELLESDLRLSLKYRARMLDFIFSKGLLRNSPMVVLAADTVKNFVNKNMNLKNKLSDANSWEDAENTVLYFIRTRRSSHIIYIRRQQH